MRGMLRKGEGWREEKGDLENEPPNQSTVETELKLWLDLRLGVLGFGLCLLSKLRQKLGRRNIRPLVNLDRLPQSLNLLVAPGRDSVLHNGLGGFAGVDV